MLTTGTNLASFIESLNGDAAVDATLADILVDTARTIVEAERPWMVLRKTNRSLSASSADTWETAKSLAGITDFGRFYGDYAIRLFDGMNCIADYQQKPWDSRLDYKDVGNTFVYDANSGNIYLNGLVPFSGTLYLNYIADPGAIDLTADTAAWSPFPPRFLAILGYYAIGIHKGAVDYDSINRQMLPSNQAVLDALRTAMVNWDNELQLSSLEGNDPSDTGYPRSGAISRD